MGIYLLRGLEFLPRTFLHEERFCRGLGILAEGLKAFIWCRLDDSVAGGQLNPEEEDKILEAMEQLRINYNLRQWRVCSLICQSLADKFKAISEKETG